MFHIIENKSSVIKKIQLTCFKGLEKQFSLQTMHTRKIQNQCRQHQTRPECVEYILHRQVKSLQCKALKWACSNYYNIFCQEWLRIGPKVSRGPLGTLQDLQKSRQKNIYCYLCTNLVRIRIQDRNFILRGKEKSTFWG